MYFIKPSDAAAFLYNRGSSVDEDMVSYLCDCIAKGVFTHEDITYLFSEDDCAKIIESQSNVPVLDSEVKLKVTYQAEEYTFEVVLETVVDLRLEEGRIPMAKLIGAEIQQKIINSGEIVAIEAV